MRIFIFEHMCGGGLIDRDLPDRHVRQGAAMLKAISSDFIALGVDVMTTLDERVELDLDGAQVLTVRHGDRVDDVIDQLAAETDRALVIAPEWIGVLEHWTTKLTASGARRLGSSPEAVTVCADKYLFAQRLAQLGVPAPQTMRFEDRANISDGPVIVKLRHGAGCDNTFRKNASEEMELPPWRGEWIVQRYVPGDPVSVSMIVHRNKRVPLLAGLQHIGGEGQLHYSGGEIPIDADLAERAIALADRAAVAVPGLRGWIGIDLILAEDPADDVVIEINPRVTMSYIGLRALAETNLAAAILDSSEPVRFHDGHVLFDADGRITESSLDAATL